MHPSHLLTDEDYLLLDLFGQWRRAGLGGGAGYLPFSGGTAEQPALLMQAFKTMSRAAAMMEKATSSSA